MRSLIIATALLPSIALAGGQPPNGGSLGGNLINGNFQSGQNAAISTGQIGSNSAARSVAGARSNASVSTQQGQAQRAAANNAGNTQSFSTNYPVQHHNNPDLAALVASTANTCAKPGGGTFSGMGFGFGILGTPESDQCNRRLNAAALVALGRPDAALRLLAKTDEVREALQNTAAGPAPQQVAYVPPEYCNPPARGRRESTADRLMRVRQPGCQ